MRPSKGALIWSLVAILFFIAYASGQSGRLQWVLLFIAVVAGGRAIAKVRKPLKAHARRDSRYLVDVTAAPMPAIQLVAELRSFGDLVPHAAIRQLEDLPARVELLSNEPDVEDLERRLRALGVVVSIAPAGPRCPVRLGWTSPAALSGASREPQLSRRPWPCRHGDARGGTTPGADRGPTIARWAA